MVSNVKPLVFVDLDDTLFQTKRKMKAGVPKIAAALSPDGSVGSFMSNNQSAFVDWLFSHADVIPVTARGRNSFKNVLLPFEHGGICGHGGEILSSTGERDTEWLDVQRKRLAATCYQLNRIADQVNYLKEIQSLPIRLNIIEVSDTPAYLVIKQTVGDDKVLDHVRKSISKSLSLDGFYIHQNGNNLALIPETLNKKSAVKRWIELDRAKNGARPIIGFGDSLSDFGFLSLCDWWGTPNKGQITNWIKSEAEKKDNFSFGNP